MDREIDKERLERLIMGLEHSIESLRWQLPYYKPDDLQLVYAKKFLAASEQNLEKARAALAELEKSDGPAPRSD